jgi:hypothetical protein
MEESGRTKEEWMKEEKYRGSSKVREINGVEEGWRQGTIPSEWWWWWWWWWIRWLKIQIRATK